MHAESLLELLRGRFSAAIGDILNQPAEQIDPIVRPSADSRFGDYQCNAAMSLARAAGCKPRELAERIAARVRLDDVAEAPEIAGPGFINVRLRDDWLASRIGGIPQAGAADRLDIPPRARVQRVIVDYSSPNIAKQMHVGHIRSTIIGDVIARVLAFLGDDVIRQNHVGDWGTQMGMVILGIWHVFRLETGGRCADAAALVGHFAAAAAEVGAGADPAARRARLVALGEEMSQALSTERSAEWGKWLGEFEAGRTRIAATLEVLTSAYRFVNAVEDAPESAEIGVRDPLRSRPVPLARLSNHIVAEMLHARHEEELHAWRIAREVSLRETQSMYERLGVLLRPEDVCGESFFHDRLEATVAELRGRLIERDRSQPAAAPYGVVRDDHGAVCVFLYDEKHEPQFRNPDGEALPLLIRKSDGAFLYATTDLAAVRYRIEELGARRLIYVTDARQVQHFRQFFAAARAVGWACHEVSLEHVTFGSVMGEDRRPLKTRSGATIRLSELLDEAEERVAAVIRDRQSAVGAEAADAEVRSLARAIGVAAVKYADLKNDRNSDYVFSWDKMVALQGNTAPYLLYAYARLRSILREAAADGGPQHRDAASASAAEIVLGHTAERALALRLLRFREALAVVAADLTPHVLCSYVYDLSSDLTQFYEACPVLKAPDARTRDSRLRLCDLTARTLKLGLELLGIQPIERI
ncbi:MAG: arginine--tRNA ligase [Phycisphaerales bacterium]|nr:arginine--tRNA ligase [Phycisphaerales bacterium]